MEEEIERREEIRVLTRDVKNPKPDRRVKHDWRRQPVWYQGTKFRVETRVYGASARASAIRDALIAAGQEVTPEMLAALKPTEFVTVRPCSGAGSCYDVADEDVPELMAALKPAERDLASIFEHERLNDDAAYREILQRLVDKGIVSLDQVETALREWSASLESD